MKLEEYLELKYRYTMVGGGHWLSTAQMLKTAADNILDDHLTAVRGFFNISEEDNVLVTDDWFVSLSLNEELFPVYMLLAGYAIENIFKGIIICRTWLDEPSYLDKDNFEDIRVPVKGSGQPMRLSDHGVLRLRGAKAMQWNFKPDEEKVLKDLNEYVLWGGRYPVPKKHYRHHLQPQGVIIPSEEPIEIVNAIYKESFEELFRLTDLQRHDPRRAEERSMIWPLSEG